MRKRTKVRRSSTESSEDESLITLVKRKQVKKLTDTHNINPQNVLLQDSEQCCEFCDGKFSNKLEALVHNARHIVIPLLRQPFAICSMCKKIFPSRHDVKEHTRAKHPMETELNGSQGRLKTRIEFEDDTIILSDSEVLTTNKIILGSKKVEKAAVLNSFTTSCSVNVEPLELPSDTSKLHEPAAKPTEEPLTFDLRQANSIVINGLPDVIKESLSLSQPLEDPTVSIVLESSRSDGDEEDEGYDSIPYSELTLPIYHKCEHCRKTFTNKFEVANHSITHLRIRQAEPGACIVCERRPALRNSRAPVCAACAAQHCATPGNTPAIPPPETPLTPQREYTKEKCYQQNLCDVCYVFKMKGATEYVRRYRRVVRRYLLLETVRGEYRTCDNCNKSAYETRVVRCVSIQTCKQGKLATSICFEEDRKQKSNVDRLKSIQNRLKRMNFMSKKSCDNVSAAIGKKSTTRWPIFYNPRNAWNT